MFKHEIAALLLAGCTAWAPEERSEAVSSPTAVSGRASVSEGHMTRLPVIVISDMHASGDDGVALLSLP